MNAKIRTLFAVATIALIPVLLTSCYIEDPGPLQQMEKTYDLADFDRLEMGDALVIRIEYGNAFLISARGDERNINDLIVKKEGSTLIIKFDDHHIHKHQTYIDVTMPSLREANFSGASSSVVSGFRSEENFRLLLSGASVSQLDMDAGVLNVNLSGASSLALTGNGNELVTTISGASILKAFDFPVEEAYVNASGASSCKVTVSHTLDVVASGASAVFYRGNPEVNSNVSGGSTVHKD